MSSGDEEEWKESDSIPPSNRHSRRSSTDPGPNSSSSSPTTATTPINPTTPQNSNNTTVVLDSDPAPSIRPNGLVHNPRNPSNLPPSGAGHGKRNSMFNMLGSNRSVLSSLSISIPDTSPVYSFLCVCVCVCGSVCESMFLS